jgi:Domain of unknown function (DUF4115)
MVGMAAVFVVGAIVVVGAVVARVTWRRPADERHSIQSHQQTLETLRAMADRRAVVPRDRAPGSDTEPGQAASARAARTRTGPDQVGSVPAAPAQGAPARSVSARSVSARSGSARAGAVRAPATRPPGTNGRQDLVFVDNAPAPPPPQSDRSARASALALSRTLPRSGLGRRRLPAPRRRAGSRIVSVVAAVVVLGIVVGIALALAPAHHTTTPPRRDSSPPKTSVPVSRSNTTVPPPPEIRATTDTSSSAAYSAPATPYTVALRATGLCWVEATQLSTGHVVWTGTLTPGEAQSIPATGSLFVRLGAADNVSVTLNGEQVQLPAGFQSPFDMSFETT